MTVSAGGDAARVVLVQASALLFLPTHVWSMKRNWSDFAIFLFILRMELRCVVAVIRHGDRTPKQKMKLEVKHPMFFDIFRKYDGFKNKNIKLKKPQQLQEILDVSRRLLEYLKSGSSESELIEEKKSKLEQIKNVLEMYGTFQKWH